MANVTTYSFADVIAVFNFPGSPSFPVNGTGIGELSISYITDNTAHDLSADGSVMVSKIAASNANITVTCQQTSALHNYLKAAFKYLQAASSPSWAAGLLSISSVNGIHDNIIASGLSFTKRSDQPYQQQGQLVTWTFMSANCSYQF
jgi:hypothetical protein